MSTDLKPSCCHEEIGQLQLQIHDLCEWVMSIENCRFDVREIKTKMQKLESPDTLESQKFQCELYGLEHQLERLLDGLFHYSNRLFQSLCQYEAEPDNLLDRINIELHQCAEDDIQTGLNDRANEFDKKNRASS